MPPAARVGDMHTCPMVTPGTPPIPHVGGPILPPGAPTVLIDFIPAATVTNLATCVGPPDVIVKGSAGVFINYLPAARIGDQTAHGGVIIMGSPTCIIGEVGSPSPGSVGFGAIIAGIAIAAGIIAIAVVAPEVLLAVAELGEVAEEGEVIAEGEAAIAEATESSAASPAVNEAQTANLERFADKLPNGASEVQISEGANGARTFSSDVPGKVPGSKATYYKEVDADGVTTKMGKRTYDPDGNLVHDKVKFP